MLKKSFRTHIVLNVALVGAVIFGLYKAYEMAAIERMLRKEALYTENKISELKREKDRLETALAELGTESVREREAKEHLNLKKAGETVVVVVPEEKKTGLQELPVSLWARVERFFKKLFY